MNVLTTGYFELHLWIGIPGWYLGGLPGAVVAILAATCTDYPVGKCRHGIDYVPLCDGINKDKPGRTGHTMAKSLAEQASIDFIEQILDDPSIQNNEEAIAALMGPQGSLAFVIDDTVGQIWCVKMSSPTTHRKSV